MHDKQSFNAGGGALLAGDAASLDFRLATPETLRIIIGHHQGADVIRPQIVRGRCCRRLVLIRKRAKNWKSIRTDHL